MNKLFYYIGLFTLFIAILLIVYFFYLLLYPFKTVDLVQPIKVLNENKTIHRGQDLIVEIEYVKYGNYKADVAKNIICNDGNLVTLAPTTTNFPMGYHKYVRLINVPQKTSLGTCHLQYINTYKINPLRDIVKTWITEDFKVIK